MAERTVVQIRDVLARGDSEAQVRLRTNDAPLSEWVATVQAFDAAVIEALQSHRREEVYITFHRPVD